MLQLKFYASMNQASGKACGAFSTHRCSSQTEELEGVLVTIDIQRQYVSGPTVLRLINYETTGHREDFTDSRVARRCRRAREFVSCRIGDKLPLKLYAPNRTKLTSSELKGH